MKRSVFFLTGATGLLGGQILKQILLANNNSTIFVLIRGKNLAHSKERLIKTLRFVFKNQALSRKFLLQVRVLNGDQSLPMLGLDRKEYSVLLKEVRQIFHSAALAEFRQPLEKVRLVNVEGTKNILKLAKNCKKLEKFHFISTAFLAGNYCGSFSESQFMVKQKFNNNYEQSKFEAEQLVRRRINNKFKTLIFRPSIVVGEFKSGVTNNFRMFYQPFRTLSKNLLEAIPVNKKTRLNVIPCDTAARMIYLLSQNIDENKVYHITGSYNIPIMRLMRIASRFFGYREPNYVNLKDFDIAGLTGTGKRMISPYIPYFNLGVKFESDKTEIDLKKLKFEPPVINDNFILRLFSYCRKLGYIKSKKGRAN